jgi:hypothetical protein
VGQVELAVTTPLCFGLGGGVAVGAGVGSPVTSDYKTPFAFTGKLYAVTVDVSGNLIKDDEMNMKAIMARQYIEQSYMTTQILCNLLFRA